MLPLWWPDDDAVDDDVAMAGVSSSSTSRPALSRSNRLRFRVSTETSV